MRSLLSKTLGLAWQRPLPHYARQRFDRWFARRERSANGHARASGAVGRHVCAVSRAPHRHRRREGPRSRRVRSRVAGRTQVLWPTRLQPGQPGRSAAGLAATTWRLLNQDADGAPIIFLEPSCYSMFVEDYRELKLEGAESVAKRCFLFEQFIESLLNQEPDALKFNPKAANVVIHAHCHAKALANPAYLRKLAERLPERNVTLLDTGCCGMAGAFGMTAIQIRAVAEGGRAARSEGARAALWHDRGRLRHQLPPSDRAPRPRSRPPHGRGAGGGAGLRRVRVGCLER